MCLDNLLRWDLLDVVYWNCIKVLGLFLSEELRVLAYGAFLSR
jgi:hypothetical protein